MRHWATLFDRAYLAKGLCLQESLWRHSSEPFVLHILAMDTETLVLLDDLKLENVDVIPLSTFERTLNLTKIKEGRTWAEYCWTCASNFMEYLLPWMPADGVTYLDADGYFFSDPKVVFDEIGDKGIGITPHRFPAWRKDKEINGKFNVGLVHAKNTDAGRKCIAQWAANCRAWCFNRVEGSHACGDQKYLDDFERDYPGEVCAIQNIGVNLAPWNVEQYRVIDVGVLRPEVYVSGQSVVFYHFHEYLGPHKLTNYQLRPEDREYIYAPYIAAWTAANSRIAEAERKAAEQRHLIEMEAQRA